MKYFYFISVISLILVTMFFSSMKSGVKSPVESIYDIKINSLMGDSIDLSAFKGKNILFVNVASQCGFTPQYEELQQLHEKYGDKVQVIGVPCNQFGSQEPGNASEIKSFCQRNYGVTFLITEKVDVKGDQQHPLYQWLTQKEKNGANSSSVMWNFQKYLVDENGNYVDYWRSTTKPLSSKITQYFK